MTEEKPVAGGGSERPEPDAFGQLSDVELDALLANARAAPASEALKRRMLDDHRMVTEAMFQKRPRWYGAVAARQAGVRSALGAGWAGLVRYAAPAGAFAALCSLGFFTGVNSAAPADKTAYLVVASAFSDVADEVEEVSLWAE